MGSPISTSFPQCTSLSSPPPSSPWLSPLDLPPMAHPLPTSLRRSFPPIHTDVRNHTMYFPVFFLLYKFLPQPVVPCSQRSPPSMHPDPPNPPELPQSPSSPIKFPKSSQLVLPKNMIPYLCYLLSIYN